MDSDPYVETSKGGGSKVRDDLYLLLKTGQGIAFYRGSWGLFTNQFCRRNCNSPYATSLFLLLLGVTDTRSSTDLKIAWKKGKSLEGADLAGLEKPCMVASANHVVLMGLSGGTNVFHAYDAYQVSLSLWEWST